MYSRKDTLKAHIRSAHLLEAVAPIHWLPRSVDFTEVQLNTEEAEVLLEVKSKDPIQYRRGSLLQNITADQVQVFLDQFWDKFHPTFPILHRRTFEVPQHFEESILVHVMCCIGAKYIEGGSTVSDDCFAYCVDYLDRHVSVFDPNPVPIDVFQAGLLAGYSGLFWGRSDWYKWASGFTYQLILIARETGMFQHAPIAAEAAKTDWQLFLKLELSRRSSYALFFIDGQMCTLLNNPPKMSHYEIKHVLPCDDALWEAGTEAEWQSTLERLYSSVEDDDASLSARKGGPGVHFLEALQQTLICGSAPPQTSSFGGMIILLAIHIMIRNMTQFAGILETCYALAQDPYSRRSQLGNALDGLRFLIPRRTLEVRQRMKGMWGLFESTLHLALIHLHLPDTAITSGVVEPDLGSTIATAAALTQPQSIIPPGTAFLGNDLHKFPYETMALVTGHIGFFLKTFNPELHETNPLLTYMFYKVSLVTWLVLRLLISRSQLTVQSPNPRKASDSEVRSPLDPKQLQQEFMTKHLAVEILSHVEHSDKFSDIRCYEDWIERRLASFDTWGVGQCGAMSFKDMLLIGDVR